MNELDFLLHLHENFNGKELEPYFNKIGFELQQGAEGYLMFGNATTNKLYGIMINDGKIHSCKSYTKSAADFNAYLTYAIDVLGYIVNKEDERNSLLTKGQSALLFLKLGGENDRQYSLTVFTKNPLLEKKIEVVIRPLRDRI